MRRMYPLLSAVLLAVLLAGCGSGSNTNGASDAPPAFPSASPSLGIETASDSGGGPSAEPSASDAEPSPQDPGNGAEAGLKAVAGETVEYLRERDMVSLGSLIDPERGLRFSPYPHVNAETDLVFKPDALPTFKDSATLNWGTADGSGEPIELSFRDYYEKYVYNSDFADAPNVNVNKLVGQGNAVFNVPDVYPGSSYVEYHFPGTEENGGMDWQSLVLVFLPSEDDWKLVGIVHGQWTI